MFMVIVCDSVMVSFCVRGERYLKDEGSVLNVFFLGGGGEGGYLRPK